MDGLGVRKMGMKTKMAAGRVHGCLLLFLLAGMGMPHAMEGATIEVPSPIDVFLLIDQSGSMKQTDPEGARLEASKYLVGFLAAERTEVFDHRLGVIHFGTTAPADKMLPLTPLVEANLKSIKEKLVPLDLGDTSFIAALQRAAQGFQGVRRETEAPKRQQAIVIFTDGEPDDPRKLSKEAYFREIQDFVSKELAETAIYVVAIDAKGSYWPKDRRYWERIASGGTYRLERMDEKELEKVFTGILLKLLKRVEIKWDNVPAEGLDVEVEPYLERITFSILKENPEVRLTIRRANGQTLTQKDPDVRYFPGRRSEIFSVADPSPGRWKYEIEKGRGKVEVGKAVIPIEVRLRSPSSPHPQGKPMRVAATFLKRDGTPVKEHPAYRLWLGAKLITPDGRAHFVEFKSDGRGLYTGTEPLETAQGGLYRLSITMKGGNLVISQQEVPIAVEPIPYLDVLKPREGSRFALRRGVELEVRLLRNGLLANPADIFVDHPNSLIWAQIEDPKGKIVKSLSLEQAETKGLFTASLPRSDVRREGRYTIRFQLSGRQKTGERFQAVPEEVPFFKEMDGIDFVLYRWYVMIASAFFLLLLFDWARIGRENEWWLWRFGLPTLSGQIYLHRPDGEAMSYDLSGRRVDIGRRGRIVLDDPEIGAKCGFIAAVWRKTEEGYKRAIPKIRYASSPSAKRYDEVRDLADGDSVTIAEKYTLEYRT